MPSAWTSRSREVTEQMAALSLQGPKSRAVLNRCCEEPLDKLKYFRLMPNTIIGNVPVTHLAHRIHRRPRLRDLDGSRATRSPIWDALMEAGDDYGIAPCGILAMDMARVEAGLFMIDVDYTAAEPRLDRRARNPRRFEMGLDWAVQPRQAGLFRRPPRARTRKARRLGVEARRASKSTGKAWSGCSPMSACRRKFPAWRCAAACR